VMVSASRRMKMALWRLHRCNFVETRGRVTIW
jgi:hypothetical protein